MIIEVRGEIVDVFLSLSLEDDDDDEKEDRSSSCSCSGDGCLKIFASLIFQLAARWTRHTIVRVCMFIDKVSIGLENV